MKKAKPAEKSYQISLFSPQESTLEALKILQELKGEL